MRRFNDFQVHLDVPRAVLVTRLRDLVDARVLARESYAPGRDEYVLTEHGLALWPAVFEIRPAPASLPHRRRTDPVSVALLSPHRMLEPLVG